jgi:membrane protease subunit HflK
VVLVVLFVLSGFQRINTGESGISLRFGDIKRKDLSPGGHFAWPYPIGQVIKVSTSPEASTIEFLPELSDAERQQLREEGATALAGFGSQLSVRDGYVLTADQAIGHVQWQLRWRRADAALTVQNMHDAHLARIVEAVVRSAIVRAAATHTIDEMLRATPESWRDPANYEPLADAARRIAQETLDEMDSGVEIDQLSPASRFPPRGVIEDFSSVSRKEQEAAKEIADASTQREARLMQAAGGAAETILAQIEQYERDLAVGDEEAAVRTFASINALLSGEPAEIDGEAVSFPVSGRVASIRLQAEQFRSRLVSNARTDAAIFQAKLAAFEANPAVMIHTDWSDAMTSLLTSENVQAMLMDATTPAVVTINPDPEIKRELERKWNEERRRKQFERSQREREDARYEREQGITMEE